jgi:hypothetical protein
MPQKIAICASVSLGKKIVLLNQPDSKLPCYAEVMALEPRILGGDLDQNL